MGVWHVGTHPLQGLQSCPAALALCVLGEAQVVLGYAVGEVAVGLPTERTPSKNKFVGTHAERPPVDGVCVSALREYLGGHVRHRARHAVQQLPLRVVHGDVEIRNVRVPALVQ